MKALIDKIRWHEFYTGAKKVDGSQVSVTEVCGGEILQAYLKRVHDIGSRQKITQATLGSIFDLGFRKLCLERVLGDDVVSGSRITIVLPGGVVLSGEPDIVDLENSIVYDVKLTKKYTLEKVIEEGAKHDYVKQLNFYRWMLWIEDGAEMKLLMGLKDQNEMKDKEEAIVELDVPRIENDELLKMAVDFATELNAVLNGEKAPPAKCNDTWGGMRCKMYCDVSGVCPYAMNQVSNVSKKWGV